MAIIGLTVTEKGEAMQRLAVTTKVAIGEVVETSNGKTRPAKLDHFIFLKKEARTNDWEDDPELTKHYGEQCRDIQIILLNDELENVFRTELAWWSATEKKCWGDGCHATRKTQKSPYGEPWQGCGDECKEMVAGVCKPSGDLYFVLAEFPKLGSVCRIHTTSYKSIRQLYSALEQIRTITGGRLAGIKCRLTVTPDRATYMEGTTKKTTTVYVLNLEISSNDMKRLVADMTQHAQLFQQTRGLLTDGRRVEYLAEDEDEVTKARELAAEFPTEQQPAQQQPQRKAAEPVQPEVLPAATNGNGVPKAVIPKEGAPATITSQQRRHFFDTCVEAGWGNKQVAEILLKRYGLKSSAEIPADKYDAILASFQNGGASGQDNGEDIPY